MAAFNGKWTLKDLSNGAAYFDAINSPEEYKTKLRTLGQAVKADSTAYVEEFNVDTAAKTIQRVVYVNGEKKKDSGVVSTGVEVDHPSADGRPAKVKVTIESDTKITRTENGDGFSTVSVFQISGNSLTVTSTGGGQTATMTYNRA